MKLNYDELNDKMKKLVNTAIDAKKNSYAPISGFKVGAAILADTGEIFSGVNVEITSFSPTICAERNAIFSMFTTGERNYSAIAVCGSSPDTFPCGVCRQVIYETSPECEVLIVNSLSDIESYRIQDLLPHGFRLEE